MIADRPDNQGASQGSTLREADYEVGADYLRAAMPGLDATGDPLPRYVERNESAVLVVLWSIDNCDAFDGAQPEPATVELRTIIRTSRRQTLPVIAAPGFSMDTLRSSGACP